MLRTYVCDVDILHRYVTYVYDKELLKMGSQPCLNSKMGTVGAAFIAQWIFVRLLSCGLGSYTDEGLNSPSVL